MIGNLASAVLNSFRRPPVTGVPPATVASVDITRYLGRWYEVARLPNPEQDGGGRRSVDVTATYAMKRNGTVDVMNRARDAGAGMRHRSIHGYARKMDSSGAKLKVTFFHLFGGDYWVLGLDPEYRWAVVGTPSRRRLWVLSRTPRLEPAHYDEAIGIARAAGYDPARIVPTPQSNQ
jgi:apolipoprotein D and lipocalin family protein